VACVRVRCCVYNEAKVGELVVAVVVGEVRPIVEQSGVRRGREHLHGTAGKALPSVIHHPAIRGLN
jgi:hypothetical protein